MGQTVIYTHYRFPAATLVLPGRMLVAAETAENGFMTDEIRREKAADAAEREE